MTEVVAVNIENYELRQAAFSALSEEYRDRFFRRDEVLNESADQQQVLTLTGDNPLSANNLEQICHEKGYTFRRIDISSWRELEQLPDKLRS